MHADSAAGMRFLWSHRLLRNLAVAAGVVNLGGNAFFGVFVLWLVGEESRVGMTAAGYGRATRGHCWALSSG